jgi:hypothetical protein
MAGVATVNNENGTAPFSDKPPWLAATTRDENTQLQPVRLANIA